MAPYGLPQVIAEISPPPMNVPMPIRKVLLVDGENKVINYLIHGEYELNTALKGKGQPRGSQYQQRRKQAVKSEATALTSHSETVND